MKKTEKLSTFAQGKTCPLQLEEKFVPCDINELAPILSYLEKNISTTETNSFTKGTVIDGNRLDLCKQKIGPDGAKLVSDILANNTNIISLMLGADGILNDGAIAVSNLISKNKTIETVYLGCNLIDSTGANALAGSLKVNKTVKGLWLKRNPIGDKGLESMADMLKNNNSIEILDLVNTEFTLEGLKTLVKVLLEENNTVKKIFLDGNHINEEGAFEVSKLLSKSNVKGLYLNVNHIGDIGAKYISDALKSNTSLEELGLASNNIGVEGIICLCESLINHPSIKTLDLGYSPSTKVLGEKANFIGDEGVENICNLIKNSNSLRVLNLLKTGITEAGIVKIIECLENNSQIVKLDINIKDFSFLSLKLREILKRNISNSDSDFSFDENSKNIKSVYRTGKSGKK